MSKNINSERTLSLIAKLMRNRYLYSIRHGFTMLMPLMVIGALAILFNQLPLDPYQQGMAQLFGPDWRDFGALIYAGTFSVISLAICLSISYQLAGWYKENKGYDVNPLLTQLISFTCAVITMDYLSRDVDVTGIAGVNGMFLTIVLTILATELFMRLLMLFKKHSTRLYTQEANFTVPMAMEAVFPALITIVVFALFRLGMRLVGIDNLSVGLNQLIEGLFASMQNTTLTALFFSFATHFMWIFGIHGNNVLDNVAQSLYVPALADNAAAIAAGQAAPHVFTKTFFDAFVYMGGSGTTICLIIALLMFARSRGPRRLAKISLAPGIFNINEPLMYGLPVVLNPVYVLPFLGVPIMTTLTSYIATVIGLVPPTVSEIGWTTPVLLSGYAATGSIAGSFLQLFNIVLGVSFYMPFVRFADRLDQQRFGEVYHTIVEKAEVAAIRRPKRLIEQYGDVGSVARQLGNDLSGVLSQGTPTEELYLHFQPLIDAREKRVFGFETLLRWEHPIHGNIVPPVIVALAEDTGLIVNMGKWIIERALEQLHDWRTQGFTDLIAYVNISMHQLAEPDFPEFINHALEAHDIPPGNFEMEITESVALSVDATTNSNIERLHKIGLRIAIDDFGMGHSSLRYLQIFPSTTIKIDDSLTTNVGIGDSASEDMVRSITSMCERMGIGLIAEHVETKAQLDRLMEIGVYRIQGYFFSTPLAPDAFVEYVRTQKIGEVQAEVR